MLRSIGVTIALCAAMGQVGTLSSADPTTALWDLDPALRAAIAACSTQSGPDRLRAVTEGVMDRVEARRWLTTAYVPAPVRRLQSAGVTRPDDPALLATRAAFRDADTCALMAIGWAVTGNETLFDAAHRILLSWAATNVPTGHPVDETRLDGLLWAYDLMRSRMGLGERQPVQAWLRMMASAKRNWTFGPATRNNNYMTHHLKLLLMLDKLLDQPDTLQRDQTAIEAHLGVNLRNSDGSSLDFHERDSLHYHVFDTEAWVEIALLTGCCRPQVEAAYLFLQRQLATPIPHREFLKSEVEIDRLRSQAGFENLRVGEPYDQRRATRLMLSYATLHPGLARQELDVTSLSDREFFAYLRGLMWRRP